MGFQKLKRLVNGAAAIRPLDVCRNEVYAVGRRTRTTITHNGCDCAPDIILNTAKASPSEGAELAMVLGSFGEDLEVPTVQTLSDGALFANDMDASAVPSPSRLQSKFISLLHDDDLDLHHLTGLRRCREECSIPEAQSRRITTSRSDFH